MKFETLIGETPAAIATSRRVTWAPAAALGEASARWLERPLYAFLSPLAAPLEAARRVCFGFMDVACPGILTTSPTGSKAARGRRQVYRKRPCGWGLESTGRPRCGLTARAIWL